MNNRAAPFLEARDLLLEHRCDYDFAYQHFRWPELGDFNWALDYFDPMADTNPEPALWIVNENGGDLLLSFADLAQRSNQVANFLQQLGIRRGESILLMLGNEAPLWESILAAMKIGAVVVPTPPLINDPDLADRLQRSDSKYVICGSASAEKFRSLFAGRKVITTDAPGPGSTEFEQAYERSSNFEPRERFHSKDPLLLYFTSGTTAKPKLVLHTQRSYPVGHLSTMYWIGIQPGDRHLNISSPGWAKHAWSSFFAPWNAGACVLALNQSRFRPANMLDTLVRTGVTTLCAPPTVWRMLIKEDLASYGVRLRETVSGGEPLNPEVVECVRRCWGVTLRDGYGQTETTALAGNTPGQALKLGSMGRPLPGYRIVLHDATGSCAAEGEICVDCASPPAGLTPRSEGSRTMLRDSSGSLYYGTGDVARKDDEGYLFFVGRTDDVFKASDYRISPFELESVAIEYPAVLEAAVVPSPDPARMVVPKAFITLAAGYAPDEHTAQQLFCFLRDKLAPYKRIRRLEFCDLPKTMSGKIRRAELRKTEQARGLELIRRPFKFFEQDFQK